MKKYFIILFFLSLSSVSRAQESPGEKGDKFRDSLVTALANTKKPIEQFDLLTKIGEHNLLTINTTLDSAYCLKLLHIAQQLNNDSLKAISYDWIGTYYFYLSDYAKALEFFIKGVPLAEKANDKRRLSSLYLDIVNVYQEINNPDEVIRYILKAENALPDKTSAMYNYMAIQVTSKKARYFLDQQKPDSAFHYAQQTKEINLSLKSPFYEGIALGLTAHSYEQMGDHALAEVFFKKAIALADSTNNYRLLSRMKNVYSQFLLRQKRIGESKVQAVQNFQLVNKVNDNSFKQQAAENLVNIYDSLRQTDSAFYYAKIEKELRQALFSQQNLNKIQAMGFNEQIRLAEEDAKKTQEALERNQNIQYSLLALGIILFVIAFLLLSRRHITNTKAIEFLGVIALLVVFEFLNLLLHPLLTKITSDSPVLMLLAMVCVAAL